MEWERIRSLEAVRTIYIISSRGCDRFTEVRMNYVQVGDNLKDGVRVCGTTGRLHASCSRLVVSVDPVEIEPRGRGVVV